MAASRSEAEIEDFFLSRNVLSEGSRIRCRDEAGLLVRPLSFSLLPRSCDNTQLGRHLSAFGTQGWCLLRDVERYKTLASRAGLLRRFHEPSLILRNHERSMQRWTA